MGRPRHLREDLRHIKPNDRKIAAFDKASGGLWWIRNFLIANDRAVKIERIGRKQHQNF